MNKNLKTKFEDFVNENISNANKEFTNKIYDLFIENGYGEYKLNFNNNRLKLIDATIKFENNNGEKLCYFDEKIPKIENYFDNLIMKDVYLYFSNFNINSLKEEISHETVHVQEMYDKLIFEELNSIKKTSTHNIINYTIQKMRNKNKYFDVFLDIIYRTTDNELNCKLNEIYFYLKKYKSEDKKFLKEKLKKSEVYNTIEEIENLDFKKLSFGLLNSTGVINLSNCINEFNKLYFEELTNLKSRNIKTYNFLKYKVYTNNDVIKYFEYWEEIIKNKFEKFYNKLDSIIEKVITDIHFNENNSNYLNVNTDDNLIERIREVLKNSSEPKDL